MAEAASPSACPPERWREVRRVMGRHRPELARLAAALYPGLARAGTTPLLARPEWLPAEPLPLDRVTLSWQEHPPPVAVTGTGPAAAHVLPGRPGGGRYASYAEAIAGLDAPALLQNRVCYRLLGGSLTAGSPALAFTRCRYFDAVNLGHAAGHEFAAAWQRDGAAAGWPGLPLRAAAGDPCDLPRRAAITAVTTLTLRREPGGAASFVLHWRDPAKVNHAGGMYQVMPAGIFQPVAGTAASVAADLSLWRCLARELSEEFLGTSEDYPLDGGRLDYQRWPFYLELERARADGLLRVWCLGLGVDPLTLATDILTVAVLDGRAFDALLGGMVAENAEGEVVTEDGSAAIPFTAATAGRFGGGAEPVQPAGAALLQLAWRHRRVLLG
jgi:hypothetical protein